MNIVTRPFTEKEKKLMNKGFDLDRDKMLFSLGLKTGFRISELLSIKLSDVVKNNRIADSLTVEKKSMKGKLRSRTVPLGPQLQFELIDYIESLSLNQEYLFESNRGSKLTRCQAWRRIKLAAKNSDINDGIGTHSMRKTFANKIYKEVNHDIYLTQAALGHADIQTTVKYLQLNQQAVNKAILKIQA